MLLDGKSAVVTGSSKGIGKGFAVALAGAGAGVVVNGTKANDVNAVVSEIKSAGGKAVACVESVATMAGAQRIIKTAVDSFGRLDILVNNAGNLKDRTFMKMSEQEWDEVIAVHLKGTWACSKAASAVMAEQQRGRIINVTSGAAWGPGIGQSNYGAAKGGILSLTYGMANELSRYNITVNAFFPRALTQMTGPLVPARLEKLREEAIQNGTPIPTAVDIGMGSPDMIAPLVVFLGADESKEITGKIFCMGGEKLTVYSRNVVITSALMSGGWTVDGIRKLCRLSWRDLLTAPDHSGPP